MTKKTLYLLADDGRVCLGTFSDRAIKAILTPDADGFCRYSTDKWNNYVFTTDDVEVVG